MNTFLRIPLLFGAFIVLGLVFGYMTFKLLSFSRTVEVPSLTNMTLLEANEALTKAGLYLKIEGEDYDGVIQTGRILRQDLPPGDKVKEKRSVKVVVSKGPRIFNVPLLVGQTVSEAEAVLVQKGLRIGRIINVHSDFVEKGKIVAQKPEPDDKLSDVITVLVSLGPHELTYYCPDFQNKNLEDAKEIAGKIGLMVATTGDGNIVKFQKPRPGTPVKGGDTINFEMKEEGTDD